MKDNLTQFLDQCAKQISSLPEERRLLLDQVSDYIIDCQLNNRPAILQFICTHNSRRSHMAQLWAAATAIYADLDNVECYSGGTEATRFHQNAKKSMESFGFTFNGDEKGDNPLYLVDLGEAQMLEVFSKLYDDPYNPQTEFAAIMVCDAAAENCPFVAGATKRIALTYDDPKEFDEAAEAITKYNERSQQIALEMLYVMQRTSNAITT